MIQATGKVVKRKTARKIRKHVYVGLALRANSKSSYEVRIFPKGRRFKLLKNGDAVAAGKNKAISPLDKRERIRLQAIDSNVIAKVNGKRLAKFHDNNPGQVKGRKTALTYGNESRAGKDGFGKFQNVKVFVPTP